jgi:hypothetical protein
MENLTKNNKTEGIVSQINSNVFFQEFTFSRNTFCPPSEKQELELADNIVWLDDLLFIYQIKDRNTTRNSTREDEIKWYKNKVLKKGVKQIKDTVKYLSTFDQLVIENERGYKLDIGTAKPQKINKLIIFSPSHIVPDKQRFQKFYDSKAVGLIHLFHVEDYFWICKYLITPAEVQEYLEFREELYRQHKELMDNFPEQYVLGHFLNTDDANEIIPEYITTLKEFDHEKTNIYQVAMFELFRENIPSFEKQDHYLHFIQEIAKLNRSEFEEFKKRFFRSLEQCQEEEITLPYRIALPRTGCGFVFIPLPKKFAGQWKTALLNLTFAHKYEQKLDKCIGIVVFPSSKEKVLFEVFWEYLESAWTFDAEMEKLLKDKFPFREVKLRRVERYKV